LNEGLADGSARVITAPRVTAIDGLTASLTSTERRSLDFNKPQTPEPEDEATDEDDKAPNFPVKATDNWKEGLTFVESQTGFIATPVLHGDLMNLRFQIILDNVVTPGNTVLRDGQTLAIRLPNANPQTGWPRVVLVKARILRRAGDDVTVYRVDAP